LGRQLVHVDHSGTALTLLYAEKIFTAHGGDEQRGFKPGFASVRRIFDEIKNLLRRCANGFEEVTLLFIEHRWRVLFAGAVGFQAILEEFTQSFGPVVIIHGANKAQIREKLQASTFQIHRKSESRLPSMERGSAWRSNIRQPGTPCSDSRRLVIPR